MGSGGSSSLGGLYFNFAWQMAWSLFSIYQIKYAGATGFWVSLFVVANQISQVVSFKWWERMAGKIGNVQLLVFVVFGMAIAPLLTIISTNLIYQVFVNLLTGFFVAGTVLLLFNQLLEFSGEEKRTSYITNYNTWLAVIGFIAPQFGVFLLEEFGMNIAILTSFVLRASSGLFFLYLFREEAMPFVKKVTVHMRKKSD
ncbi:hypothetical protein RZN25_14025 [Bacillaceae bacterium S4-13-56]